MSCPLWRLLARALVVCGAALPVVTVAAVRPTAAAAGPPPVFLLGDSVMAGLNFSSSARGLLAARYAVTLDAKVCRAIVEPSCYTVYDGRPPAALTVMRANRGRLGRALVMMVGYNDSAIGPKVDAVMAEAASQGLAHVLWLTYRDPAGRYAASNATLAAKARQHAALRIADWNGLGAAHPDWFAGDGLHLTGAGATGLANFINANLGPLVAGAPPRPVPTGRCGGPVRGAAVAAPSGVGVRIAPAAGFVAAAPVRVLDTRARTPVGRGRALTVDLSSRVPAGATAAVVNLTAVAPCGPGYLTAYACSARAPLASNVNYVAGRTTANLAVTLLGSDRRLCVYSYATTDLVVDVFGWFRAGGLRYQTVTPVRLVDTRPGTVARQRGTTRLRSGGTLVVHLTHQAGAPLGASGALLNVTAVGAGGPGYLTVSACGTRPVVSSVNYGTGQATANLVATTAAANGTVCVYAFRAVDVVVDLEGWFGSRGTLLMAQTPQRLVDTRTGRGGRALASRSALRVVSAGGGTLVNVTAVAPRAAGYLTVYPCGAVPVVSSVNYTAGASVPGVAAVRSPGGRFCVYSMAATDLVVDRLGRFG
jgi:hypothetical protein